jgi:integrase
VTLALKRHVHKDLPWLWLGKRGKLIDSGIAQALRNRGTRVGIPDLHAHDFRDAATHHELAAGMNEADVMSKRGWDSPAMLRRYASTTANERAIAASGKLGLGDKL